MSVLPNQFLIKGDPSASQANDDKKQKGKTQKNAAAGSDIGDTMVKIDHTRLKYMIDINSEGNHGKKKKAFTLKSILMSIF